MIRFILIVLCASCYGIDSMANAGECQKTTNVDDFLGCLIEGHPQLDIAKLDVGVAEGLVNRASQRPNPQLQWQGTETQGASGFTNEFNLNHTIELGSKQPARVKLAESELELQKVGIEGNYNLVKIELIERLYRLRQINHEIEVIEENRQTFLRMISQYSRIGKMNPEQEISVNVFRMASEEVQLKLGSLKNEKDEILSYLKIISGQAILPDEKLLPPLIHEWPTLNREEIRGPILKQAKASVDIAKRRYELEKAESWPDISVGPRIVTVPGFQGGTFVGAAVTLPLPVLSLNRGGRESAFANVKRREFERKLIDRRINEEAQRLIRVYERSSKSYTMARKSNNIHLKHKKLHKMIKRGVVSPSMVIELHRQIIEFYQSLHSQELAAVKARWNYYALLGNTKEKKILEIGRSQ